MICNDEYDYLYKIIIIGDCKVGKTCFQLMFTANRFLPNQEMTIGVDFSFKIIECNGYRIKIQIWDTAGQESFRSITRHYFRDSAACIIMYDITNRSTFNNLNNWLQDIKNYNNNPNIKILLVGNKCDLEHIRSVPDDEGQQFANQNNLTFFESSSKNSYNVFNIFQFITESIVNDIKNGNLILDKLTGIVKNNKIDNYKNKNQDYYKCCIIL